MGVEGNPKDFSLRIGPKKKKEKGERRKGRKRGGGGGVQKGRKEASDTAG